MENVVPSTLQRLRATDIIRMAGLATASLGQEYYRIGAVHSTQRRAGHLAGVVDVPYSTSNNPALTANSVAVGLQKEASNGSQPSTSTSPYPVDIELQSVTQWTCNCSCGQNPPYVPTLCAHGAALLYQWLARPMAFVTDTSPFDMPRQTDTAPQAAIETIAPRYPRSLEGARERMTQHSPALLGSLEDILIQLGLSELRGVAREYDIIPNGMNKQQLAEAILEQLGQPEAVRKVAATLEKSQRQLLAALILAGGSVMDEDLRGLFERFKLGQPNQLQGVLIALQGKGLLFRTSLNSTPQQRIGLSGALLDIGWYVPMEVRTALHVNVPTTPFDITDENSEIDTVEQAQPYSLLANLLLVARSLDAYNPTYDDVREERNTASRPSGILTTSRVAGAFTAPSTDDGSTPLLPPTEMPSASVISRLRASLDLSPEQLRFAVRLLRLADILHKDDNGTPNLRMLPNAAQLLLGPSYAEVLRDLFDLWLDQPSYEELFELTEEGLRLRCRATSLNQPLLRTGEVEMENREARQSLIALLAQVPLQQWVRFNAFARFVYRINPLFLQKRQRLFTSPHWWIEQEEGHPLRPSQLNDWLRAEGQYLSRLLRGPLHWWGACDLAFTPDGSLLAFRLTPIASWLLHGTSAEALREEQVQNTTSLANADILEAVRMQEVLIPSSHAHWPIIELMETFTEVAGVEHGRLRYRITPKALAQAISQGHRPEALLQMLRTTSVESQGSKLSALLAQVERWIASYGRVRVYTGVSLLETADTVVMRELSATTSLDGQIVQTLYPTLHILKKSGAERVVEDLKRRGQTPLLHGQE